ncbi:tetratricopeptide repeat protein [Actinokineospora enzanensis]|uniref:tetratricopeptide repeat protein n=1 Tax=Actinokineospora enzanensis TaxID=155975 RepID=UPI00037CEE9C|nr:tetratricopeptide repeat protein [Actinokineospora enzanensis]
MAVPVRNPADRLLHALAQLSAAPIPRELITPALVAPPRDLSQSAIDRALDQLRRHHLVTARSTVKVHPLARQVVRLMARPAPADWALGIENALIGFTLDRLAQTSSPDPVLPLLVPHLVRLTMIDAWHSYRAVRALLNSLADRLRRHGDTDAAVTVLRRILKANELRYSATHPRASRCRRNLAAALQELGRHREAARLHRATYDIRRRTLGADHPHTLRSQRDHADALPVLGRHRKAAELYRAELETRAQREDHPNTLDTRTRLATALHALGRYEEAADLHRAVLTVRRRTRGERHPSTLRARVDLAVTLDALGRTGEAAELRGEDHRST